MADARKTPNSQLRDLDNPTAAFPIGALNANDGRRPGRRRGRLDEDETELRPMVRARGADDDDEIDVELDAASMQAPPRRVTLDLRFLALWLIAASGLAMLAAVATAAVVLFK
jgi:hypothetical protein